MGNFGNLRRALEKTSQKRTRMSTHTRYVRKLKYTYPKTYLNAMQHPISPIAPLLPMFYLGFLYQILLELVPQPQNV